MLVGVVSLESLHQPQHTGVDEVVELDMSRQPLANPARDILDLGEMLRQQTFPGRRVEFGYRRKILLS
jgi:hypothetical protein